MHPAELVVDRGDIIAAPLPGPLSCSSSPAVPAEVLPTPFACSTGSPQTHRPVRQSILMPLTRQLTYYARPEPANVEAAPIPVEQPATSIVLSNLSKSTLPPQFMESTKLDYPVCMFDAWCAAIWLMFSMLNVQVPEITPGEDANPEAILSPPRHAYTMSSSPPDPVIAPLPAPENSFASTLFSTLVSGSLVSVMAERLMLANAEWRGHACRFCFCFLPDDRQSSDPFCYAELKQPSANDHAFNLLPRTRSNYAAI